MERRFRGVTYRALLPRLPRNLLVFDGRCLMSQARVRYVLERNFNYFKMLSYFMGNEGDMSEQLDRHRIHLLSFNSSEADELRRLLLSDRSAQLAGPTQDDPVLLFVERVSSQSGSLLLARRARATSATAGVSGAHDPVAGLFQDPTTAADSYAAFSGESIVRKKPPPRRGADAVSTQALQRPEDTDLLVSTDFAAVCRVGMHLDRWLVRSAWRVLYKLTPRSVGNWWFDRFIRQRRRTIWGTSEKDAVSTLGMIDGMKERRWSWRTRYPS